MSARRNRRCPPGEHLGKTASIFVVPGHCDSSDGTFSLKFRCFAGRDVRHTCRLLLARSWNSRTSVIEKFEGVIRFFTATKTRRTEKHHCVLDLFAPEAGQ